MWDIDPAGAQTFRHGKEDFPKAAGEAEACTAFRPVVEELMTIERRNAARLRDTRCSAEQEKQDLDKSSRNLRQLHKSYVPPARAHWQSYS